MAVRLPRQVDWPFALEDRAGADSGWNYDRQSAKNTRHRISVTVGDFMRDRLRNFLLTCAIAVAAGFVSLPPTPAAEPLELRWDQLIPESLHRTASRNLMAKILPDRQIRERANMSMSQRSDLVVAYNGQRVKISGFAVPFNNDEQPYKRLLLIPFSGACDKFPPPRNQAVLVLIEKGIRLTDFADPVAVTGVMSVAPTETDIAKIGYRITAEAIVPQE
jgi:uncharacterized protein